MTQILSYSFCFLVILAGAFDFLTLRIPNVFVVLLIAVFVATGAVSGTTAHEYLLHALTGGGVLLIGFALYSRQYVGAGDVKFAAAIALWLGPFLLPAFFINTLLAGGLVAMAYLIWFTVQLETDTLRPSISERLQRIRPKDMPYGPALAAGALLAAQSSPWLFPTPVTG